MEALRKGRVTKIFVLSEPVVPRSRRWMIHALMKAKTGTATVPRTTPSLFPIS